MEKFYGVILQLERELRGVEESGNDIIKNHEFIIRRCKEALRKLRDLILALGFPDKQSEIKFFKEIKPSIVSRMLYSKEVIKIEGLRFQADASSFHDYLKKRLSEIKTFMECECFNVQYYYLGFTHLDEAYFLRNNKEIPEGQKWSHNFVDDEFYTWHDHTFSLIRAKEMLMDYLKKHINELENSVGQDSFFKSHQHTWTGKNIDLAEIIYAFDEAKVIDNGRASITEITRMVGHLFGLDLTKDIHGYYKQIQRRKKDQTPFLNWLKSVLQKRIDDDLEK